MCNWFIYLLVFFNNFKRSILRKFLFAKNSYIWRRNNRHNRTFIGNIFPLNLVSVGNHSYGILNVKSYPPHVNEKLIIGNFVSIAEGTKFVLGGNHQIFSFSPFPFRAYFTREDNELDSSSKGPIKIGDHVWIGTNALILSGVNIGTGSIIGAGCVVTKDIPPFSIVVGNPCRILKKRFSDDCISEIQSLPNFDLDEKRILNNLDILYIRITSSDDVTLLKKAFK